MLWSKLKMPSEYKTGSQTATISTEHNLSSATETESGVFQVFIDTSALAAGDFVEFRVKEKARSADTQREVFVATVAGPQGSPMWVSPPLILLNGWAVTLKQTEGTGRAFPWSIRKA
jgi:hypothetical protein